MAKKKNAKATLLEKATRPFRIPPPSPDAASGQPTLVEDLEARLRSYMRRNSLSAQEMRMLMRQYVSMYNQYQDLMVKKHGFCEFEQLTKMDCIDVTGLGKENIESPMYGPSESFNAGLEPVDEQTFYLALPCFPSGILQLPDNRVIHFEVTDLETGDLNSARISLAHYRCIPYNGANGKNTVTADPGRRVSFLLSPQTIGFDGVHFRVKESAIIEHVSFTDLYTCFHPREMNWTKGQVRLWEQVVLQNAVDQDEKFKRGRLAELLVADLFVNAIISANVLLSNQRPVIEYPARPETSRTSRPASGAKPASLAPVDPDEPVKKTRIVGTVKFVSAKLPKAPSQKTLRQYHLAEWKARGHMRHYKSGKVVYIRPAVKRRKALQGKPATPTQSIIKFKDNRDEKEV